jgi:alpha-D-xyloside xylohydrolase
MWLGAFLPVFRSHGTDTPREIWNFGEPGTPFYDSIEKAIRLRYRLMPYIYSLAGEVVLSHSTMMRPLIFDFPQDKVACGIYDQFMLGKSMLACPVTEPMGFGAKGKALGKPLERSCWLPEGALWHDFWTGETHSGGKWITADAPLDRIPVFVRAGSVIPMETAMLSHACQRVDEPIEMRIYPGEDGLSFLYEDDGEGYGYESGQCNRIELSWDDSEKTLSIGGSEFGFPQGLSGRSCIVRLNGAEKMVSYNGEETLVAF